MVLSQNLVNQIIQQFKFGMVTDYSFIKLPVGGNGTDDLVSDNVNLRITFAV